VKEIKKIELYTDGAYSKKYDKGGIGVYGKIGGMEIIKLSRSIPIPISSQRTELLAVYTVLYLIQALENPEEYDINIYSDSAYIINCIKYQSWLKWIKNNWTTVNGQLVKHRSTWTAIIYYMQEYYDLTDSLITKRSKKLLINPPIEKPVIRFKKDNFIKVPGHDNCQGNNIADSLAVKAKDNKSENIEICPEHFKSQDKFNYELLYTLENNV